MTEEKNELDQTSEEGSVTAGDESSPESENQLVAQDAEVSVEPEKEAEAAEPPMAEARQEKTEEPPPPEAVQEETEELAPVAQEESATVSSEAEGKPEDDVVTSEEGKAAPQAKEGRSQVDYSKTFRSLSRGDLVDGVVVHIDKEGVLVDVGTKSEGIIRPGELSARPVESPEDVVSVGETIDVYVMQLEDQDGNLILSKKRADFEKAWDRVQQAFEEGKVLTAMVTDRVKGGLQVDLGVRGFVPGSHVGSGKVKNLDRYVGQSLPLKVIEVDRERRKVVLSHRLATEEQRTKQRQETIASLTEGQVRTGMIRRLTEYGAFVDLGGIDGLLHISEMSWTRIGHPSEVVKVGQKINIMILRLDPEAGRVSLGLRQILPDPWSEVEDKYKVGDVVRGTVSRLVPFGAFVQLGDIEAILPNTELSRKRVKRPDDVVSTGETVEAQIVDIRADERRMTLSLRRLHEDKERKDYDSYQSRSGFDGRMTLGDLVGDKLQELVAPSDPTEKETTEKPPAEAPAEEPSPASEAEPVAAPEAEAADVAEAEVEAAPEAEAPAAPEAPEAADEAAAEVTADAEATRESTPSTESTAADVEEGAAETGEKPKPKSKRKPRKRSGDNPT